MPFSTSGKLICYIAIFLLLSACSETPELLDNNDPSQYSVSKDVLWASPDGFDLTMDIYTPARGADSYPVVIIYHGGGWLINDKSIMDQMAKYLATNSDYVICNVNYRLLVDNDNTVTLNQIVDDAFGAVLWVKDNISRYKGDETQIAVTGDSAGGHLSAMIVNMGDRLISGEYSEQSLGFNPSYLPAGKTAEQVAQDGGLDVQAAILSYGSFDLYEGSLQGFETIKNPFWLMGGVFARGLFGDEYNVDDNPSLYKAVSPIYNIPVATERELPPQLLTVGSEDFIMTPASVKDYMEKMKAAGHSVQYWEYEGRGHAFLDSGSGTLWSDGFEIDAPPALDVMIAFLNKIFYSVPTG
jgi:acetyl esterase/lipase